MSFGRLHLGPLLPEFLARHPGIEVELTLNDRFVDLLEEGFDLAVRIGQLKDSSLIARRLATARSVCAASPAYLARAGGLREPGDLARHNCLRYTLRPRPDEWSFRRGAELVAVRIAGNLDANNGDALRSAALEGLGVVYLPDFIIGEDLEAGRLVALLPGWQAPEFPIHAVFPSQRHASAKLRVFVEFLVEKLGGSWPRAGRPPSRPAAAAG
jgi:DNA-binding transcriptional LysR family regulator